MNGNIFLYTSFIIIVLFSNNLFAQQDSLQTDRNQLIVGTWVHKGAKTPDGKEYKGLTCHDTIQYNKNENYVWKQCTWNQDGKWKFNEDKTIVIHYDIHCAYWEKVLGTKDLGESHGRLISLSQKEMITVTYLENEGEIWEYYTKLN
ncbi:hypothetical protein [uncultured Dokdonia sp.]|uniref:hypothetical protein n=1 Tax=uncultured Dokdonia sp. TaxID=575653 RepID=UPI0026219E42|nr:hypothetical protein [uncultured Dokdonia sp.]